jgi:hypothetical protein
VEMPGRDQIIGNDFLEVILFFKYCSAICKKKAKCPNDIFKKVFRYVRVIMDFYLRENYYEFKWG